MNTVVLPWSLSSTSVTLVPADLFGLPLLIAFVALVVVLAVASVAPALHAMRVSPRMMIAQEDAGLSTPRWRGRRVLIVAQVAVALILANIAVLAVTQLLPVSRTSSERRLAMVGLQRLDARGTPHPFRNETLDRILIEHSGKSGMGPLALASELPSSESAGSTWLRSAESLDPIVAAVVGVSGPVLDVIGARIVRGRALRPQDSRESVVVVSESATRRLFGSVDVIGRPITIGSYDPLDPSDTRTIVGIASDLAPRAERALAMAYIPLDQANHTTVLLLASTPPGAARPEEQLEELAMRALPDVTVSRQGFGAIATGFDIRFEVIGALTASLGITAMVVAMGGLFGLLSHLVARRRREMGVRMALGATRVALLRLVLLQGLRPVALGLAVGLGGALLLQRGIEPLVLRNLVVSWPVIALLAAAFLLVAAVATYLPARSAASVDPSVALRQL